MIYKPSPPVRKSKHLLQLWYLNRQRHCWSPSQRLSYIVGGKSHSKQYKGQETPLLQPPCTLKSSLAHNPPVTCLAAITCGPFKAVSLFYELRYMPPLPFPLSRGRRVTADLYRKKHLVKGISVATACRPHEQ